MAKNNGGYAEILANSGYYAEIVAIDRYYVEKEENSW